MRKSTTTTGHRTTISTNHPHYDDGTSRSGGNLRWLRYSSQTTGRSEEGDSGRVGRSSRTGGSRCYHGTHSQTLHPTTPSPPLGRTEPGWEEGCRTVTLGVPSDSRLTLGVPPVTDTFGPHQPAATLETRGPMIPKPGCPTVP